MRVLTPSKLLELQSDPSRIRNICIMAHVDHGKTTLVDSLLASNGIISQRMAGKLRYMDSRKDEQERGITMKSSSVTLHYSCCDKDYLVNVIDSPGHVDFSSEVSTAVRLCDGAVIMVDVVEGVCPQTQVALKQAWMERIKPILVLNKIDRLILELKLTPLDAYIYLSQVLEQVNAVMGELFAHEVVERAGEQDADSSTDPNLPANPASKQPNTYNWSDGLEDADDSNLYFSPCQGNVVFASAIDGWAFNVDYFAKLYSPKLGKEVEELRQSIWGNFYLNSKMKILPGAQEKAKKPLFVQLVLENIWRLYETICVRKDKEKMMSIVDTLGVKVMARDLRQTDPRLQLHAVCSQWLPLSSALLDMVCKVLPPANELSEEKVEKLMCSSKREFSSYPEQTRALKQAFILCSSSDSAPTIVFVSKMFPMERKLLPEMRQKLATVEELAKRREEARLRHTERQAREQDPSSTDQNSEGEPPPPGSETPDPQPPPSEDVFMAFARVYSGTLTPGQSLYVLGPKHMPEHALKMVERGEDVDEKLTLKDLKAGEHMTKVVVSQVYLMMGRDLEVMTAAPAGNVIAIGGLEEHVMKSATLSSVGWCPSFSEMQLMAVPILKVAVEPTHPTDLPALRQGLRLLNQADACVQVLVQETGEHVLVTAGEVHLERCLTDLRTRYAKIELNVSEPIVPFRETVVEPPKVDMVNETIQQSNPVSKKENDDENVDSEGIVTIMTANRQSVIRIQACPLPDDATNLLEKGGSGEGEGEEGWTAGLRSEVAKCLVTAGDPFLEDEEARLWSSGPRHCGPNLLLNHTPNYSESRAELVDYESSFINGFQLASMAGPLCEEPMMGVGFIVHQWDILPEPPISGGFGPLSGQIVSAVKEACRKAFQAQPQRLMLAMYTCTILSNSQVLGKVYGVLGRRQGRVVEGDRAQGSQAFTVKAVLPVAQSFNLAHEIRKHTSGLASPHLAFSHWEVLDVDPYWSPSTEEEYLLYGEKADSENRARQYMDGVRRRKGLPLHQQVVLHAEKQRTLSKKK